MDFSEAPSMTTILAGMILVLGAEGLPAGRRILRYMAGGAVLAFSACLRPSAVAVIAALAVWMIRSMGREGSASLTIIAEGTEPLRLEFSVKYSDCRKGAL